MKAAREGLERKLADVPPEAFRRAVEHEARRRLEAFSTGVRRYHQADRLPRPGEPPVFWQAGTTRLLDYGGENRNAPPVLVIPSLINRAYIADLTDGRSFVRDLAAQGYRPFLLDWGAPGEEERTFTLTDYVTGRVEAAVEAVTEDAGQAAHLVGYCMGGNLALAHTHRRPETVRSLVLAATPWDFHAARPEHAALILAAEPWLTPAIGKLGTLPVDALQTMFAGLKPYLTVDKFRRFGEQQRACATSAKRPETQASRHFIALEDWLNDGVPLAAPVALECLFGWYGRNTPGTGGWQIAGTPVRPEEISTPALVVVPERDHIVPPASALALAERLPNAETRRTKSGHIGMVAGSHARATFYAPVGRWLTNFT